MLIFDFDFHVPIQARIDADSRGHPRIKAKGTLRIYNKRTKRTALVRTSPTNLAALRYVLQPLTSPQIRASQSRENPEHLREQQGRPKYHRTKEYLTPRQYRKFHRYFSPDNPMPYLPDAKNPRTRTHQIHCTGTLKALDHLLYSPTPLSPEEYNEMPRVTLRRKARHHSSVTTPKNEPRPHDPDTPDYMTFYVQVPEPPRPYYFRSDFDRWHDAAPSAMLRELYESGFTWTVHVKHVFALTRLWDAEEVPYALVSG